MRRLILLPALVLTLGLALAAPVAAAPENNPQMRAGLTVTCGSSVYSVMSKGVPGWMELAPGATPTLYMGGTHYLSAGPGAPPFLSFENPIPPGMAAFVTTCRIAGYWDPDLYLVIDPAYLFFTPHAG